MLVLKWQAGSLPAQSCSPVSLDNTPLFAKRNFLPLHTSSLGLSLGESRPGAIPLERQLETGLGFGVKGQG